MWRTLQHRGVLSLAGCLTLSAALALSPVEAHQSLRSQLLDLLRPGTAVIDFMQTSSNALRQWGTALPQRLVASTATIDRAREEELLRRLDRSAGRIRSLELKNAQLQQSLADAHRQAGLRNPNDDSGSLWRREAIPARILAADKTEFEDAARRLLGAGRAAGIRDNDLVFQHLPDSTDDGQLSPLLIDRGASHGLAADGMVLDGHILVGRILQAGRWVSTVQRLTDPEFRVGVQILRNTPDGPVFGAVGVFAGTGERLARLELVDATEPVSPGDAVYTVERLGGLPTRLFVGHVVGAELEPGAAHWSIAVEPAATSLPPQVEVVTLSLDARTEQAHP